MTTAATLQIEADVKAILRQGGDPTVYRASLASLRRVSVEAVDAAIAAVGGAPRIVDAETVAQGRMAEDRRMARENRAAWRADNHEE